MKTKKTIALLILAGVVVSSSAMVIKNTNILNSIESTRTETSIKLENYKSPKNVNTSAYQVDKYNNTNIAGLISDNEALTLTTKNVPEKTVIPTNENYYCSIYNLNDKSKKDFKDVNIANFYGLSPDKKHVLYMEPVYVSKDTPEEAKKAEQRGSLYHGLKVLDLSTGKVNTLIPDHSNGEFKWISNDKIWASFFTGWQIIGLDGKIYASGDYPVTGNDGAFIVGADIKDLGDSVDGKIYYSISKTNPLTLSLQSMDINTKETKDLFSTKNSLNASKQGNTIVMSNSADHGETSPGIYNRTYSEIILDSTGKLIRNIALPSYDQYNFILSPDGSMGAYVQSDNVKPNNVDSNAKAATNTDINNTTCTLKIFDIKTGSSKEIIKCPYISNVIWNSKGDSLSFTSGRAYISKKLTDADGMRKFSITPNENINSYVVTFDK